MRTPSRERFADREQDTRECRSPDRNALMREITRDGVVLPAGDVLINREITLP